jgi:LDH2 family malate/lactate/ureidoglycolate dehydrogenase
MTTKTTIAADSLMFLSNKVLEAAGLPPKDAAAASPVLVEGDMMGIGTHGVGRLPGYCERIRVGGIAAKAEITVDRRAASLAIVDGGNALGPLVGAKALEAALDIVRETGIAYVGCRNSNHFGAIAPYALMACEAEFVSIMGTGASTTMPPWGGAEARIGNNPIGIAAPCDGEPHFILDMAMSVAARGKIRAAQAVGRPIPEGWAVNADGQPTTDPSTALAGFLVPFGGHKGSGLSQAVDLLSGVLSGARFLTGVSSWVDKPEAPQGIGHFFLLIDPERLIGREAFQSAMQEFRSLIQGTPPADPAQPVLLPGQREQIRRARALREGIAISASLLDDLRRLAGTG